MGERCRQDAAVGRADVVITVASGANQMTTAAEFAALTRDVTGQAVKLAYMDQCHTSEEPAAATQKHPT